MSAPDSDQSAPRKMFDLGFRPELEALERGAMARSLEKHPFVAARPARGIHRHLCRLGFHAWETRVTYNSDHISGHTHQICVVCRKRAL